ncbi:hypothetical protein [Rubritalea tangerina]|uniref:Uncharacterized protein n=1 Tax=Rubritalea tangerina TaxID=430798 RepID=A0ABW4Z9H7_9BACT
MKTRVHKERGQKARWRQLIVVLVCALSWFTESAGGHPPDDLMKVQFTVIDAGLLCEAEVHFSQVYALKRKFGGEVGVEDYAAIERSFEMNCPVKLNGEEERPKITEYMEIGSEWGQGYLDHPLDEEERRVAKVVMLYSCDGEVKDVEVKWGLIPRQSGQVDVFFEAGDERERFRLSLESSVFSWSADRGTEEMASELDSEAGVNAALRVAAVSPEDVKPKSGLWLFAAGSLLVLVGVTYGVRRRQ